MDNLSIDQTPPLKFNNVVYIEFLNKKNFPPGDWMREPDHCEWDSYGLHCLALRDMKLGIWRGFVSIPKEHKEFGKNLTELISEEWGMNLEVHGGVCVAGKLPLRYKELNKDSWWIGFECTQGEDLFPLTKYDLNDPIFQGIRNHQTYKDLFFIRRETNSLAKQLLRANRS